MIFDPIDGGDPHSTAPGGRGNLDLSVISVPPYEGEDPAQRQANAAQRSYIYNILRKQGQENLFRAPIKNHSNYQPPLMPLLFGDNPLTNELPSKFLCLTETQLFFLQQWVEGKFINEKLEGLVLQIDNPPARGSDLDRGRALECPGPCLLPRRRSLLDHPQSCDLCQALPHQTRSLHPRLAQPACGRQWGRYGQQPGPRPGAGRPDQIQFPALAIRFQRMRRAGY